MASSLRSVAAKLPLSCRYFTLKLPQSPACFNTLPTGLIYYCQETLQKNICSPVVNLAGLNPAMKIYGL
jgi:hypothetical protein